MRMNLLSIQSTEILSMYFGQTEQKIRDLFQQARLCAPCLLLFDDFDALAHKRSVEPLVYNHHSVPKTHPHLLSIKLEEWMMTALRTCTTASCPLSSTSWMASCPTPASMPTLVERGVEEDRELRMKMWCWWW
ncbi:AAA family ATPase [archaeon]|nr:MAG: AAA family ATPase [archaeon]